MNNETVYISGGRGDTTFEITVDSCKEVASLKSNHEEADTRMLLHAAYAADNGANCIVINSPDTDVLVLLLHHRPNIHCGQIFFWTGRVSVHTDLRRFIPVDSLLEEMTPEQRNIVLPVYCLTGCDTCSFFYGKGKRTVFKALVRKAEHFQSLADLGSAPVKLSKVQTRVCTAFVGGLYGHSNCSSLNQIRCEKAKKSVKPRNMPPCDNSFYQHCLRSVLQLWIWKSALKAQLEDLSPTYLGYEIDNDNPSL